MHHQRCAPRTSPHEESLLSRAAADRGFETRFSASRAHVLQDGKEIVTGTRLDKKLYRLNILPLQSSVIGDYKHRSYFVN